MNLKPEEPLSKDEACALNIQSAVEFEAHKCPQISQNALVSRVYTKLVKSPARSIDTMVHVWDIKSCITTLVKRGLLVRPPQNP